MGSDLYPPIGAALKKWLSDDIKQYHPRFCCEFEKVDESKLFNLFLQNITSWESSFFLLLSNDGDPIAEIVEKSNLKMILKAKLSGGYSAVSIVDPSLGCGCTIDWDTCGGNTEGFEVLIVAWGKHSGLAKELVEQMGAGYFFRGN